MGKFEKLKKIEKFIIDNDLTFDEGHSCLNSDCCTISGFALHVDEGECDITIDDLIDVVENTLEDVGGADFEAELARVFEYAENNNYGEWWTSEEAKIKYNF
jgi:hypothetical protein